MPLSLYYAPIAVGASMIAVPLGFWAAARAEALEARLRTAGRILVPAAAAVLCLALQAVLATVRP